MGGEDNLVPPSHQMLEFNEQGILQRSVEVSVWFVKKDYGGLAQMNKAKEVNELLKATAGHEDVEFFGPSLFMIRKGDKTIVSFIELNTDLREIREYAS
jgi:hypothetical protein